MRTRYIVSLFPPLKATTFNLHAVRVKMTRFNHTNDLIVISIFPLINLTTALEFLLRPKFNEQRRLDGYFKSFSKREKKKRKITFNRRRTQINGT